MPLNMSRHVFSVDPEPKVLGQHRSTWWSRLAALRWIVSDAPSDGLPPFTLLPLCRDEPPMAFRLESSLFRISAFKDTRWNLQADARLSGTPFVRIQQVLAHTPLMIYVCRWIQSYSLVKPLLVSAGVFPKDRGLRDTSHAWHFPHSLSQALAAKIKQ